MPGKDDSLSFEPIAHYTYVVEGLGWSIFLSRVSQTITLDQRPTINLLQEEWRIVRQFHFRNREVDSDECRNFDFTQPKFRLHLVQIVRFF